MSGGLDAQTVHIWDQAYACVLDDARERVRDWADSMADHDQPEVALANLMVILTLVEAARPGLTTQMLAVLIDQCARYGWEKP